MSTRLRAKDVAAIESAARAFAQGAPLRLVESLAPLVAEREGQLVPEVDRELAARLLPTAGELLLTARLSLLQQGLADTAPRPGQRETVALILALDAQIDDMLKKRDGHPLLVDPLVGPTTLDAYEELFWESHVLENQMLMARRLSAYQAQLAAMFPRRALARFTPAEQQTIQRDYPARIAEIERLYQDVLERDTELRVHRLAVARRALEQSELSPEKFKAAYVWTVDAKLIEKFLRDAKEHKLKLVRPRLTDPEYLAAAAADAEQAQLLAGDLTQKATWLFEGMHWWLRGRFGAGPELAGLMKSQEALRTPEAMFQLFMPHEDPTPVDPATLAAGDPPTPTYDRRHHYWWVLNDRRVRQHGGSSSNVVGQKASETVAQQSYNGAVDCNFQGKQFW